MILHLIIFLIKVLLTPTGLITPTFNFRDINETDFRISNKIASIEDLNKKAFSYYAPSLIYGWSKWTSAYENTYNGYFKYFNAHMFDPSEEFLKYITSGTISGGLGVDNLKVRGRGSIV